ncbi:MAG: hypothetical protein AAFO89_08975 [Planctomycetota bacterium]
MDADVFANQGARARAARARVVEFRANQGPITSLLFMLLGIVLFVAIVLLLIPLFLLAVVVGIVTLAVIHIRRRLRAIGRPNSRVAGVRTDGRENVRVVTRD